MSKSIIIIVAATALIFIGGMSAGFYVLWTKISSIEATAQAGTQETQEDSETDPPKPIYHLETLIVNLADKGGRRYLRVTMDTELTDADVTYKIDERLPIVKDAVLKILSTRTFDSINSIEGKNALRDEIIASLNEILKKESITNLYFTEFVVQ